MLQEKTSSSSKIQIIEAKKTNYQQVANFLNQNIKAHRHLDWIPPVDWLGVSPFLLETLKGEIQAVLCASPETKESAWIRSFACQPKINVESHWKRLLIEAIRVLRTKGVKRLAGLGIHPWFEELLTSFGFKNRQNVVVLSWEGVFPEERNINNNIIIRPMHFDDLAVVERIDHLAFDPLWQNSLKSLAKALEQNGISTVAVLQGQIVGYQISTTMTVYGHLARLAVNPDYQRQRIAYTLVDNLLRQFDSQGFWRVTVNTQSDNIQSLGLYRQMHFKPTKEEIRVYELAL